MTGCFYQELNQHDLKRAEFACKDKGGVFEIKEWWNTGTYVTCKDGKRIDVDKVRIK